MKNFLLTLSSLFIAIQSNAQYDPDALSVLDAMSFNYKKASAFQATFTQKLTNDSAGLEESLSGDVTIKGDKFVLELNGQKIFNDGTDVYTYNEALKEVTIAEYEPDESEITLNNIYDLYKKDFKYALISQMRNGDRIIELDPETRDKSYFKIRMIINKADELKSFTIYERSGNIYLYAIESFKPVEIADSYFTFDVTKYRDVEVIDFR